MIVYIAVLTAPVVRRTGRTRMWTVALSAAVEMLQDTTIVIMASAMRVFRMDATNAVHPTTPSIVRHMDLTQMFTGVHNIAAAHTVPFVNLVFNIQLLTISNANYVARRTTHYFVHFTDRT